MAAKRSVIQNGNMHLCHVERSLFENRVMNKEWWVKQGSKQERGNKASKKERKREQQIF